MKKIIILNYKLREEEKEVKSIKNLHLKNGGGAGIIRIKI